jgi:hypothetical protein
MKSVQECWQTWETPEIVSQSVPQITVATEVYMRSPWTCIGEGRLGCGAMTTGKLKLKGQKMEAIGAMGPFDTFLQLTDKVPSDKSACP